MKKIMLALCTATSLFSSVEAMQPTRYTVENTTPQINIVVNKEHVCMEDVNVWCKSLHLCQEYNGIPMLAPLVINAGMSQQEIVAALKASFGADKTVSISGL